MARTQINLSANDEELAGQFSQFLKKELEERGALLKGLETECAELRQKMEVTERKVVRRVELQRILQQRAQALAEKHAEALEACRRASGKVRRTSCRNADVQREERQKSAIVSAEKEFAGNATKALSDDGLMTMVMSLRSVRSMITSPVTIADNAVMWTTGDVFIRDGFGGYLAHDFGKFDVKVTLYSDRGTNSVRVWCVPHNQMDEQEIPHPHVNSEYEDNFRACLGDASRPLVEFMMARDIPAVIIVATEYLCTYNRESPYKTMIDFGVENRWDCGACEKEKVLLSKCTCVICTCCGETMTEDTTSECGVCVTCCLVNYVYVPRLGYSKEGINGTGWLHKADYPQLVTRENHLVWIEEQRRVRNEHESGTNQTSSQEN